MYHSGSALVAHDWRISSAQCVNSAIKTTCCGYLIEALPILRLFCAWHEFCVTLYLERWIELDTKHGDRGSTVAGSKGRACLAGCGEPAGEVPALPALWAGGTGAVAARVAAAEVLARMIGEDPAIAGVREALRSAAVGCAPILIQGERGSGRSLCARILHDLRDRGDLPFVAVQATALNAARLDRLASRREAVLSTMEPGSRTPSTFPSLASGQSTAARREGLSLLVGGGTLVVEDLDCLSSAAQAQLLRLLVRSGLRLGPADREVSPLWVVATMYREPVRRVKSRRLDESLAARFVSNTIYLPPLRERGGDVRLLATHFVSRLRGRLGTMAAGISPHALRLLGDYPWPGNVRELRDVVERALTAAAGAPILPGHLRFPVGAPDADALPEAGTTVRFGA